MTLSRCSTKLSLAAGLEFSPDTMAQKIFAHFLRLTSSTIRGKLGTTRWIAMHQMPAGIQEWRTRHASHTPSRALPLPFKLRSEVPTIQIDLSYNLRCQGQQTFEAGERICATHCLQALLCRMRAQASPATPQPPAMRESSAPSF